MKKIVNYLPFLIFAVAFLIRAWGVFPGYTNNHPDEGTSYVTAIYMLYHYFSPDRFDYPAGMALINAIAYMLIFLPLRLFNLLFTQPLTILELIPKGLRFFIEYKNVLFGQAMYWSRYVSVIFGTATVILAYFCGEKMFNKRVGLFAAFFLAFNFRHVLGSQFGLPDVYNSFFFLLSLYFSYNLLNNPNKKNYLICGIVAGIGLSMKYQPFGYLPFLTAHTLLTLKKKNIFHFFNFSFIKSLIGSFIIFVLINPYYFFNLAEAMRQNRHDYLWYQMGHIAFRPYPYFYLFHWGVGEFVSIAVLLGIVLMFFLNFKKLLLILSFVLPFMFVITIYSNGGIYSRNFVSVMPYLMLLAGFFVDRFYLLLKKIKIPISTFFILAIALVINFSNIKNSITLSYNYSKPWGITTIANWAEKNLPSNTAVRNYPLFMSYDVNKIIKDKGIVLKSWDYTIGPYSLVEFQDEGTDFAILDTSDQGILYWWRQWQDPKRFLKYNSVPFDYIQNSFYGLVTKELMRYTVYETYKPWQALGARKYVVFKIPKKPINLGKIILKYNFDSIKDIWIEVNPYNFSPLVAGWSNDEGNTSKGSLYISSGGDATERLISSSMKIIPGKTYTVKGYVKAPYVSPIPKDNVGKENVVDSNGFIRIDMYRDTASKNRLGEVVAISQRAFKTGEWQEVRASLTAPKDVQHMTISLQRRNFVGGPIYFDDIVVFEGIERTEEPYKNLPYIKSTIPLESVYSISFL